MERVAEYYEITEQFESNTDKTLLIGIALLVGSELTFIIIDLLLPHQRIGDETVYISMAISSLIAISLCVLGTVVTVQLKRLLQTIDSSSIRIIIIIVTVLLCVLTKLGTDIFFLIEDN